MQHAMRCPNSNQDATFGMSEQRQMRKRIMIALSYHDPESIFETTPDGQMVCRCPRHSEMPIPSGLARRLRSLMRGRTRCKAREITVPEDSWFG